MLPETLLCLLNVALAFAQARQQLSINSTLAFSPSSIPNPPVFSLPTSPNLTITLALCSVPDSSPRFFITNGSSPGIPGPDGGKDVFEIALYQGHGNWTGRFDNGGILAVENVNQASFELGVSDKGPIHELLTSDFPFFGDSTSNQAIIFSPPFAEQDESIPTYPNYTLPSANLSQPSLPSQSPNFTLVIAPTSSSLLTSLPQTGCMLSSQNTTGVLSSQNMWLKDSRGWRNQWLIEGLIPATNYTAYVVRDKAKVSGPTYFVTKSASFTCPLVYNLPYCPNVAYTVPLPQPPAGDGSNVYTVSNIPDEITTPLLSYLTNFTVTLSTFACGRDWYSPIVGCDDCQREYRKWLCTITFTRCGEPSPANPNSFSSTAPAPDATGLSALQPKDPKDPSAPQKVFSALVPQSTDMSTSRSPTLPAMGNGYMMLLPCLEVCTAVDRACPSLVGFTCPTAQFNAAASYGVGYKDSADGDEASGATGGSQDQWGNIWCNGA